MGEYCLSDAAIRDLLAANASEEYEEDVDYVAWARMNDVLEQDSAGPDLTKTEQNIAQRLESDRRRDEEKQEAERKKKLEHDRLAEIENEKRIRPRPPGLRVFPEIPFAYYTEKSFKLFDGPRHEARRAILKEQLLMGEDDLQKILDDPKDFVFHLSPQFRSAFILNESDFVQICDYLFYVQTFTSNIETRDIFHKALLDLLRNYYFTKWQLTLKHILKVLVNLGVNQDMVLNSQFFQTFLGERISSVKEFCRREKKTFRFEIKVLESRFKQLQKKTPKPETFHFGANAEKKSLESFEKKLDKVRSRAVVHILSLIRDILTQFKDRCVGLLAPRDEKNVDCLNALTLIHICATVASDQHFIGDFRIRETASSIISAVIESFSRHQWDGTSSNLLPRDEEVLTSTLSAAADVTEVIFYTGHIFEPDENIFNRKIEEQRCWSRDQVPAVNNLFLLDHHHNKVERLKLLLPTARGTQVQKSVAFLNLRHLVDPRSLKHNPHVTVERMWLWLQTKEPKFKILFKELYLMLSILRLIDVIVGNEPLKDFCTDDQINAINSIIYFTLQSKSTNLSKINPLINGADLHTIEEYIERMHSKWHLMMQVAEETKGGIQLPIRGFIRS